MLTPKEAARRKRKEQLQMDVEFALFDQLYRLTWLGATELKGNDKDSAVSHRLQTCTQLYTGLDQFHVYRVNQDRFEAEFRLDLILLLVCRDQIMSKAFKSQSAHVFTLLEKCFEVCTHTLPILCE